ncbi:MAG: hypothetical protein NE328_21035 [Lentisphaeraceae bacterium]|nr:hypothetical protein [Lentisphaeraceae bacterium]
MKLLLVVAASLLVWGCTKETKEPVKEEKTEAALPSTLFVSEKIADAVPVLEARKLKAGDKVTVQGKIMGNMKPFIDSRASFILGDPAKLQSCDVRPDDECPTPWDVCCEEDKDIAAGTLNIQIVDSTGRVIKTGLEGKSGLKKLSEVVIEGVVASNSSADAMTINAEKIYISK